MTEYAQRQVAALEQQTKLLARMSKSLDRIGDALAIIAAAVDDGPDGGDDHDPAEAEVVNFGDLHPALQRIGRAL